MAAESIEKIGSPDIKSLLTSPQLAAHATRYKELKQLRERILEVESELLRLTPGAGPRYAEARDGLRRARELVEEEMEKLERAVAQLLLKALVKQALAG